MDRVDALRAFVRIVELGSFTAAAEDLQLRQATVSRWIARLEDDLGVQLLDRTTRTVRITEAGQRFYDRSRELIAVWRLAVDDARGDQAALTGRLRVSVPVVFGQRFITPALARFTKAHPELEVELRFSDRYINLLAEGVDVAIRVGRPVDSELRARTLATTPRRLVASPCFVSAHGAPGTPEALAAMPCLLHSGLDKRATWRFAHGDEIVRVDVHGRLSADHSETLLTLARAGEGIALLASWLVDDAIAAGELVTLMPGYAAPAAPIQALYGSRRHPTRAARAFVDFAAEVVGEGWGYAE